LKLVDDLRGVLGEASVGQQEPLQVDGVSLGVVATPESVDAFSDALRTLCEDDRSALVTGGRTRLGFGNPPTRAELLLSTGGLRGIREVDAEEGVVQAYAGTPLAEIRDASRAAGWELPMDPPGGITTLGGALAAAAVGPRSGSTCWPPTEPSRAAGVGWSRT
jgi:glycolate oxidase FAD binding subunit